MATDYELIHGQLHVTNSDSKPEALGRGPATIRGATYLQGPIQMGDDSSYSNVQATLMIGPLKNTDSLPPIIPGTLCTGIHNPYSLAVKGSTAFMDTVDTAAGVNVGGDLVTQGEIKSRCGKHILSAKKNFDIPHPTKEGWRLRHTCPEGPSNDVYIRGRIQNQTEISLPGYWKNLVDFRTITVSLTPIGAHQDVIVKRVDESKVYLQAKGGMPINCYYHIFAERIDGEKLIVEYEGNSPSDYPGNNDEYSVSGYHYDVKGE